MLHIEYASISQLHAAIVDREISVTELAMYHLTRIAALDRGEDGLNAVLEINPDALFIARALDRRLEQGEVPGPLFGIPVLLKDNINTADRMRTSAGSLALADHYAPYDAFIAARLREAGAVILGKANMTEFANYMTEGMPSGYSSRGGQVVHPYNPKEDPSGSSSGSAVAVAAGLVPAAVGTETNGSIISPARANGIVGIKPTMGLCSRAGILPISSTLDTAGPMARSVADAAILLGVLAGRDVYDPATLSSPEQPADYAAALDGSSLQGVRIGVNNSCEDDLYRPDREEQVAFERLCKELEKAGAELVPHVEIKQMPAIMPLMRYEFKHCLDAYLSTVRGHTKQTSLGDIIAYNQAHAGDALRHGQSLLLDCQNNTTGNLTEPEYWRAVAEREKAIREMDAFLADNRLQAVLCASFKTVAPFAGFPSLTLPMGQRGNKVPMGSFWLGRRYGEQELLRIAHSTEQLLGLRLRPLL